MGIQNSRTEQVLSVFRQMFVDLALAIRPLVMEPSIQPHFSEQQLLKAAKLDFRTLTKRTESEGFSFLSVTLPKLGKWLDAMLETGTYLQPPLGFHPYGADGNPEFMRTFWALLSQGPNCSPIDDEQLARAIRIARTILYACYKTEVPSTDEQNGEALARFVHNDATCGVLWSPEVQEQCRVMATVIAEILEGFDPFDIKPRHGPGAVATGEKLEEKWTFSRLYPSLHQVYPYYTYMYGIRQNGRALHLLDRLQSYRSLERVEHPTSKVVLVPKDSRGPRVICAEPLEIQFVQQGIARKLMAFLERESHNNPAYRQINFSDQTVNQDLALRNSKSKEMATLDLKDASDMVSLELVKAVFSSEWLRVLMATRSTHAQLPDGRLVTLRKFAPMGSALCFPIESVIFFACCVTTLIKSGVPFRVACKRVFVYGDDIVVPTDMVHEVIRDLEAIGLTVNIDKSCYRANFRESCGVDAWNGFVITPIRLRKFPGQRPSDGTRHLAWCAYASRFWDACMPHASMAARDLVNRVLGVVPITSEPRGYLSVVIPDFAWQVNDFPRVRWNSRLQSIEVCAWVLREKNRRTLLDSWERLNERQLRPLAEDCDPTGVVVPAATQMKKKWVLI